MQWIKLIIPVLLLSLLTSHDLIAQAPQWSWVEGGASASDERTYGVAHDPASQGVIAVGAWSADISANFPGLSVPFGGSDGFVTKLSPDGSVVWAFSIGGTADDEARAVATDDLGNIYVSGFFTGTADFRGMPPSSNISKTSAGLWDGFVAKYDNDGLLLWVQQLSCTGLSPTNGLAVNSNGVFATGWYGSSTLSTGALSVPNIGGDDCYTVKLDASTGTPIWLRSAGGGAGTNQNDEGISVALDANFVYLVGEFRATTMDFEGFGLLTNPNSSQDEIFVAKLNQNDGSLVWSQQIGSTKDDDSGDITVDNTGIYITGGVFEDATSVSFPGGITRNTGPANEDIFVARLLKSTGLTDWAIVEENNSAIKSMGLSLIEDGAGTLYVTGMMNGSTLFNAGANTLLATNSDLFVASYQSATGTFNWVKGVGGAGADEGWSIDTVSLGRVYVGGVYRASGVFDTVPPLPSGGRSNLWVGELGRSEHIAVRDSFCVPAINNPFFLDVQNNEINLQNNTLLTTVITAPTQGTYTISYSDSIEYTPSGSFSGLDSIFYKVCNGVGYCDSAWAILKVHPVAMAGPDFPVCALDTVLPGNAPGPGTGTWSLLSGAGSITSPSVFNSPVTTLGPGINEFEWKITYLNCISIDTVELDRDSTAPDITCPGTQTETSNNSCQLLMPDYTSLAGVTDNCPVTVTQSIAPGTLVGAETFPVTLYATDVAGNVDSCTFTLEVVANVGAIPVACGTSLVGETTIGDGNDVTNYSCTGQNMPGEDRFYQITVPTGNYWIQVALNNVVDANDADLELFWMGTNCPRSNNCLQSYRYNISGQRFTSNSTNRERFLAIGPGTYFIAIDSRTNGIDSYDIAFDCVRSGITFDSTGCAGDIDLSGYNAAVNGSTVNLQMSPCQTVTICHELFVGNRVDLEWMDSVQIDLGPCYTNVSLTTPIPAFFVGGAGGQWDGTYNPGNHQIVWNFTNNNNAAYGDGNSSPGWSPPPYYCKPYTFCFTADISATCDTNPDLDIVVSIWDDGIGGAGATAASVDQILSDGFTLINPPPTITCPPDSTTYSDPGLCTTVVNGIPALANDNCPGPIVTHQFTGSTVSSGNGDASGSTFNEGLTTVTYFVVDSTGDSANCVFTVTVNDTVNPTVTCRADTTIPPTASCQYFLPDVTAWAASPTDNCGIQSIVQLPAISTLLIGNTPVTLIATDVNGNTDSCSFTVLLDLTLPAVNAGLDSAICGTGITLAASSAGTGTGTWSFLSGSGTFSPNANSNTATLSGLTAGLNQLEWSVIDGNCTGSDTVEIMVSIPPVVDAGPDTNICGLDYTLNGSSPGSGTGIWTIISGGGGITLPTDPASTITGLNTGLNVLQWTVTDGSCLDSARVNITAYDSVFADAGVNDTVCGASGSLAALPPVVGAGSWTLISGNGVITSPNLDTTVVTGLGPGQNVFQWKVVNGQCADSATVSLFSNALLSANAGPDDTVCGPNALLNAGSPLPGTGLWSVVSGTGTFGNPSFEGSSVTGLSPGGNTFRWTLTNGNCQDFAEVEIFSYDSVVADAGVNDTVCGSLGTLAANPPVMGTGIWTLLSGSGSITDPLDPGSVVSGLGPGVNEFQWKMSNGPCSDSASVIIFSIPPPIANAGPADSVCGLDAILNAVNPPSGSGQWTVLNGSGSFLNNAQFNTPVSGLSIGLNQFQWTVRDGICEDSSQVDIYAFEVVMAEAMNDTAICGDEILLFALPPASGSGSWSLVSGGGTLNTPGQDTTLVTGLTAGNNDFVWQVNNVICSDIDSVRITVFQGLAEAGPDLEICQGDTGILGANPVQNGFWTLGNGYVFIADPFEPASAFYDADPGTTELIWTFNNGGCSTSDTTKLLTWEQPDTANAGPDQTIQPGQDAVLAANTPLMGAGQWSQVSGPGGLTILQNNLPNTQVSGVLAGNNYELEWRIENGTCPPETDRMWLYGAQFIIPEVVTPNDDQKNDVWEIIGLENYGRVKLVIINRWGNPVFETDDYQNDWAGTNTAGKKLTDDTYFYVLELMEVQAGAEGKSQFSGYVVLKR